MRQRVLAVFIATMMLTSAGLVGVAGTTQSDSASVSSPQSAETAVNFTATTSDE